MAVKGEMNKNNPPIFCCFVENMCSLNGQHRLHAEEHMERVLNSQSTKARSKRLVAEQPQL